jgi:SAM-dependent methyltransferase
MSLTALRLRQWYDSPQGWTVGRIVGESMERWLGLHHVERTLGLGYCHPYFGRLGFWSDSVLGASPAEMGVAPWPASKPNRMTLVRSNALPYPDAWFDRVIMIHMLEGAASPKRTLREVWRVLKPGGRVLVVVPNRGGFWSRRDSNPFGWGRPFSPWQLEKQLREALFMVRQSCYALYLPPLSGERFRKLQVATAWEKVGSRWFAPLGGVILSEAEKVVLATIPSDILEVEGFDRAAPVAFQ